MPSPDEVGNGPNATGHPTPTAGDSGSRAPGHMSRTSALSTLSERVLLRAERGYAFTRCARECRLKVIRTEPRLAFQIVLPSRGPSRGASLTEDALRLLGDEQAALRRVATLVARGVPPEEVFAAVTGEVARLLSVEFAGLSRYEPDGTAIIVAGSGRSGERVPVGSRSSLGGRNVSTLVFETGLPARIDGYADASGPLGIAARENGVGSGVGAPVVVEGRVWGVMATYSSLDEPLPAHTEARLAKFTELLATAIANAQSRVALARLADEQLALRRVATLVARGVPPEEVFAAVTEAVGRLLPVEFAAMGRYEPDATATSVAAWGTAVVHFPVGRRLKLGGKNLVTKVIETGRPARIDGYADASGPLGVAARDNAIDSGVGTPVIVEGRPWGVVVAGSSREAPLPADTEARLASFTELAATAIANAESRAEMMASRARIVAAADETRRRIERDLHDGTQQRLVSLGLELRAAQARVPPQLGELERELSRVAEGLASVFDEVREIAHGIHPALLSEGGLGPALKALGRRSVVPVQLGIDVPTRLPESVEVAACYVVSEALTNTAKHAQASVVHVDVKVRDGSLHVSVRDDGVGGAVAGRGSGLVGLNDRAEALGGTTSVISPIGRGTVLLVELPLKGR
jgi:signal transduction histidine kinase